MPLYKGNTGAAATTLRNPWSWRPGNGAAGGADDRAHCAGVLGQAFTVAEHVTAANQGVSAAFYTPVKRVIKNIGAHVNTAQASGSLTFGLYSNRSDNSPFPYDRLAATAGIANSTTGAKQVAVDWTLEADTLYWFAMGSDVASVGIRAVAAPSIWNPWGQVFDNFGATGTGVLSTITGNALPARWDQASVPSWINPLPLIGARLAAPA